MLARNRPARWRRRKPAAPRSDCKAARSRARPPPIGQRCRALAGQRPRPQWRLTAPSDERSCAPNSARGSHCKRNRPCRQRRSTRSRTRDIAAAKSRGRPPAPLTAPGYQRPPGGPRRRAQADRRATTQTASPGRGLPAPLALRRDGDDRAHAAAERDSRREIGAS